MTIDNTNSDVQALDETETLTETYTYTVTDAEGDTTTETLTITINGVDDVIATTDDTNSIAEDATAPVTGNVLTNDTGLDLSVTPTATDGAALNYGTLTLNADGSYSYEIDNTNSAVQALDETETLTETYTYTVTDAEGDTTTETLTITINGVDDAIATIEDTNSIAEDATAAVTGNVLDNDTGLDLSVTTTATDGAISTTVR